MDELDLVEKCKQGNRTAYKHLYELYSPQLMGICLRYMGNVDSAHDVLHDSFIKIIGSIGSFQYRGAGSLRAWMSRIAVNMALTYLQKNKQLDYVERIEEYQQTDEIDESCYDMVTNDVIMQLVQELPAGCRSVFNMYMFDDMSHTEISKQLGIKEVASRVRLTRARAILADKIREYAGQEI